MATFKAQTGIPIDSKCNKLLVNNGIIFRVSNSREYCEISQFKNNQNLLMCTLPHHLDHVVSYDKYIVGVHYKRKDRKMYLSMAIFNTENMSIQSTALPLLESPTRMSYILKGFININGKNYILWGDGTYYQYDIETKQFGEIHNFGSSIIPWPGHVLFDERQKQWLYIPEHKFCDAVHVYLYDSVVNNKVNSIKLNSYSLPDIAEIYPDHNTNDLSLRFIVHDNYLISFGGELNKFDRNDHTHRCIDIDLICILDIQSNNKQFIPLQMRCPEPAKYKVLIADEDKNYSQFVVAAYIKSLKLTLTKKVQHNVESLIPLITEYFSYKKNVHLVIRDDNIHYSLSLDFVINDYLKQIDEKEEDDIFDKMLLINNKKEELMIEMMSEYKKLKDEIVRLKNKLKMYENENKQIMH